MKNIILYIFCFFTLFSIYSCNNQKEIAQKQKRQELIKVDKALRNYFFNKNATSLYHTEIKKIVPISVSEIPDSLKKSSNEAYISDVYFVATIRMYQGNRVYNVNDTIQCFLNKNFDVLRTEDNTSSGK